MATNKANILANINTKIEDGGNSTALEVRQVIATDEASVLESVYGDEADETGILQVFAGLTTISSVKVTEVGRWINIKATVTALTNTVNLIEITNVDYQIKSPTTGNFNQERFTNSLSNNELKIVLVSRQSTSNTRILTQEALLTGQSVYIDVTYNSET